MNAEIVEIKNLWHKYANDWAVKDINFNIAQTGILGLLGANGAGKSTIMNVMCGTLNQTKGDVVIGGVNIKEDPIEAKKKIGFLPQKAPLYMDSTIDEYLRYCAYLRKMAKKDIPKALEKVKEQCGLGHFSKRLVKNLSGGYKQRVGIAGAIIHNPKLVVLDEPTVGLDPVQILEVRKIIKSIGEDRAVIFSSHIMSEIQAVCSSLKMIDHGELIFSGTVSNFNDHVKPNSILLTFGTSQDINELLQLTGVTGLEALEGNQVRVRFEGSTDIAEQLIAFSAKQQWRLREVEIERSSMEDVFAALTKSTDKSKSS